MVESADKTIQILKEASALSRNSKYRDGNILKLPANGKLIVSGDLHGYRYAFDQIVKFAKLDENPDTHVVFQEVVHGGPCDGNGGCLSSQLLVDVARLKVKHPDNVHIIFGNHDCSVICDTDVLKTGKEMNGPFKKGIENVFSDRAEDVLIAMRQFLFYLPLAMKTENGLFISHSLPIERFGDEFDSEIFDRPLMFADLQRPNSVYSFTWGRKHSPEFLAKMSELLDVQLFILGHQNYPEGYLLSSPNTLIIVSEHSNGCVSLFDLSKNYKFTELKSTVKHLIDLY